MKKTVMITGAGGGLGKALTERFYSGGWRVIATDRDESLLDPLKRKEDILAVKMDVTSVPDMLSVKKVLNEKHFFPDLIINNAGIDRYFPLSEASTSAFYEIFEVNFMGGYRVNQAFIPLLPSPGGRILQISSESIKVHAPFMPYPILKRAIEDYSRSLRQELRFLGIDVILVRPGAIRTDLLEVVRTMKNPVEDSRLDVPFKKFAIRAQKEVGRMSTPEQIAKAIFRIASKKKPRFIYRVRNNIKLDLMRCVPRSLMDAVIYRMLR